jgi:hypothetical protein
MTYISDRFDVQWQKDAAAGDLPSQLDEFREALAARLLVIIDRQFGRLPELLYRIDLDERRVNHVLNDTPFAQIPYELADMIIERTLLKFETRERYRSDDGEHRLDT